MNHIVYSWFWISFLFAFASGAEGDWRWMKLMTCVVIAGLVAGFIMKYGRKTW